MKTITKYSLFAAVLIISFILFSMIPSGYSAVVSYNWTSSDQEAGEQIFNTSATLGAATNSTLFFDGAESGWGAGDCGGGTIPWDTCNIGTDSGADLQASVVDPDYNGTSKIYFIVNEEGYVEKTLNTASCTEIYLEYCWAQDEIDSGEQGLITVDGVSIDTISSSTTDDTYYCFSRALVASHGITPDATTVFHVEAQNLDASEEIFVDDFRVKCLLAGSYTPSTEQNSSWTSAYDGIDGSDYENIYNVKAIITIDSYDPRTSVANGNMRPDIEVGFYNGTDYINGSLCNINATMGNTLNTTDWNCSVTTTESAVLNAWKIQDNRRIKIRGVWLDSNSSTAYDKVNVTGVYGHVDATNITYPKYSLNSSNSTTAGNIVRHSLYWESSEGLSGYIFSFDNCTGTLANDTWVSMTGVGNWSNVTKSINTTIGCMIRWQVWANDTGGHSNQSIVYSYLTTSLVTECWTHDSINNRTIIPSNCKYLVPLTVRKTA